MKIYLQYLNAITLLILTCFITTSFAAESITLGIHPYKSPQKLIKIYTPLAKVIEKEINQPVNIVIAKDYSTHIDNIGNDKLDIAYLGPASYVKLVDRYGEKKILARQAINSKPTFQGKIIVRSDSSISSLMELKDKKFAFGDPNSTMSHLVPRYMLIENGITEKVLKKIDFLGSHDNVALSVLSGDFDAGAVKEAVFYKYRSRGLKEIATTPALSEHLFVAGNHVSDALVSKVRKILLNLENSSDGMSAMKSIKKKMTNMVVVVDADYDNLRNILDTLKSHKVIK